MYDPEDDEDNENDSTPWYVDTEHDIKWAMETDSDGQSHFYANDTSGEVYDAPDRTP